MTVSITFTGAPHEIISDMQDILRANSVSVPAMSVVSFDKMPSSTDNAEIAAAVESVRPVEPVKPARGRGKLRAVDAQTPKLPEGPALNVQADPENRVDPESAQDADDEKADSAANKSEPKVLTHDDVRNAGAEYVKKFEMPATQVDLPLLLSAAAGAETTAIGKLPNDQAVFKKAIDAIDAAVASGTRYVKAA